MQQRRRQQLRAPALLDALPAEPALALCDESADDGVDDVVPDNVDGDDDDLFGDADVAAEGDDFTNGHLFDHLANISEPMLEDVNETNRCAAALDIAEPAPQVSHESDATVEIDSMGVIWRHAAGRKTVIAKMRFFGDAIDVRCYHHAANYDSSGRTISFSDHQLAREAVGRSC